MVEPSEGSSRGRGTWRSRGRGQTHRGQPQGQPQTQPSPQPPTQGQNRGRGWRSGRGRGSVGSTPSSAPTQNATPNSASHSTVDATGNKSTRANRQMELMPSISRSGGLDKDGDSLKTHATQEAYRDFIQEKLEKVLDRHDKLDVETEDDKKHRVEEQENVLILLRKLREGISSSNRQDTFAVQVYEQSLYLSIIFTSPKHTTAIIPALINGLYPKASPPTSQYRHVSVLISLIHHLVSTYPSQRPYHQQWTSLIHSWIPECTQTWLKTFTNSLRTGNYHQFDALTQRDGVLKLLDKDTHTGQEPLHRDLGIRAVRSVVDALRSRVRETIWGTVRGAYKEMWLEEGYDTRQWLCRSLCLDSPPVGVDEWLDRVSASGHVRKKEGTESRWIVTKVQ